MLVELSNLVEKLRLKIKILSRNEVKLIVGAGGTAFLGWIPIERKDLDITHANDWKFILNGKRKVYILAEHVLEHLTQEEMRQALINFKKYCASGSNFRIAVPDGYHPSKYIIDLVKPNGLEPNAEDHKQLINCDFLFNMAIETGLNVEPIEYFDKKGNFHKRPWDDEKGYVSRTYKNYQGRFTKDENEYKKFIDSVPKVKRRQFIKNKMSYTSLFVDLIKP